MPSTAASMRRRSASNSASATLPRTANGSAKPYEPNGGQPDGTVRAMKARATPSARHRTARTTNLTGKERPAARSASNARARSVSAMRVNILPSRNATSISGPRLATRIVRRACRQGDKIRAGAGHKSRKPLISLKRRRRSASRIHDIRAFPAKSESLCRRAFGTRSRVSAKVDVVHRPSRNPKDMGQMHPAHRSSPLLRSGKGRPATSVGRFCRRQTDWVSRWRAPAASDGLGRTSGTTRSVLLADRLAIGETE